MAFLAWWEAVPSGRYETGIGKVVGAVKMPKRDEKLPLSSGNESFSGVFGCWSYLNDRDRSEFEPEE